ncbi:MAG: thiolase family protein [Dehalococcoidia bacterium]
MNDHDLKGKAAITGLGVTEQGRVYGHSAGWFAAEAIRLAVEDAGLRKDEIDGLLVNQGMTPLPGMGGLDLQNHLGLTNLRLLSSMNAGGATAAMMVQYAALSIAHGMANHVVCVFADAPLREGRGGGAAYGGGGGAPLAPQGMRGLYTAFGMFGVNAQYALAARRHMGMYGTTNDHFGAIAVAERQWATMNPIAQQREPITLEDYHASRWIAEPLHLLDCCLVSNGGVAVIVSAADLAKDMQQPPAYVWGMGQGHPGDLRRAGWDVETQTGAPIAKQKAFAMAGIGVGDIDVCQIYDCYTYTVLVTLEDYGFCPKGEGGPFVADGKLGPGGALPTNTGGGQLSGYYMWGMTPLSEGVIQTRGQGGERQAPKRDVVLVSGNGGILDHHTTLILSPHAA